MYKTHLNAYVHLLLKLLRYYIEENSDVPEDDLMECILSGLNSERAFCELCICIDTEMQERGFK